MSPLMSQVTAAIRLEGGRMVSGPVGLASAEYMQEKASGLVFLAPGR